MNNFSRIRQYYLNHFFLMIPLSIILLACVGSIAIFFICQGQMTLFTFWQMFVCVAAAMVYLGALLAQLKPRLLFSLLVWGMAIEISLILLNRIL